jgi:hypothetical protein
MEEKAAMLQRHFFSEIGIALGSLGAAAATTAVDELLLQG